MKRSVSLSEKRERIARQEDAWKHLKARTKLSVANLANSPAGAWIAGSALVGSMFLVGAIETH